MNKTSKREPSARGRRHPPAAHLTGRAGACRILSVDKRKLRRLEERGLLLPAVVELGDGAHWFDIDALRRLAATIRLAAKPQRRAPAKSDRPPGVERVSGADTRKIFTLFDSGLSHAAIVVLSGKTSETIRYLHAQWSTPNGCRLRTTPMADSPTLPELPQAPDYYPELGPPTGAKPAGLAARPPPAPRSPLAPKGVSAPRPLRPPAARPGVVPVPPDQRTKYVPDAWFNDPLPPVPDDDD